MRHTVYSALNQRMTWPGVVRNLFMVAAGAGCLGLGGTPPLAVLRSDVATLLILAVRWPPAGRQDPRFLALIPIVAGLKQRYDAGKR